MSTQGIARGIVGSLRFVGLTAVVAAGLAGFAPVDAAPAPQLDLAVVAQGPAGLPAQAREHASDRARARSAAFGSCATGEDPIFGEAPVFGEAPARGRH